MSQRFWDMAVKYQLPAVVKRTMATNWAICMEICPDTLANGVAAYPLSCVPAEVHGYALCGGPAVAEHVQCGPAPERRSWQRAIAGEEKLPALCNVLLLRSPKIGQLYSASTLIPIQGLRGQCGVGVELAAAREDFA